jgi:hypothetical protein
MWPYVTTLVSDTFHSNYYALVGHPLIHLGYAFELSSSTIAIEALAGACCFYNFLHKYLDDPSYSEPALAALATTSLFELLDKVSKDSRFDIFSHSGAGNLEPLFQQREAAILEYWNAWTLTSPKEQFEQSQKAAVALLVGSHERDGKFDFFLVHLLTSSHAVRILLPSMPAHLQVPLVRQWWLLTVAMYISQLRPSIELERINSVDIKGKDWKYVDHAALTGKKSLDAHFVKGSRAIKEAAKTWGDPDEFYLKAAVRFSDEFSGWGGFGMDVEAEALENAHHKE